MTHFPAVSVVLPSFNAGEPLKAAVRSILDQTLRNFELLVIDDGSNDGSVEYLAASRLLDERCRLIRQENQGLARALNVGLQEAKAPIIVRMDADDVAHTLRLERQVAFLSRHPDVTLVGGQARRVAAGELHSTTRFPLHHETIVAGLVSRSHVMSHPTIAFRTAPARSIGGYWDHGVAEDWDFFLRMSELGRLANLADVVLDYTYGAGSINGTQLNEVRSNIRLAVTNHQRRAAGVPELSPVEFESELSWRGRLGIAMETRSLSHYRRSLSSSSNKRRAHAWVHLALSALYWPRQAFRRLNNSSTRRDQKIPDLDSPEAN